MVAFCQRLTQSTRFQNTVIVVIVLNAAVMGLETSASLMASFGPIFKTINLLFQAFFVLEIALRLAAHGSRPGRFFSDGWNVFDFIIVTVSLLPINGQFANVGRLLRLLRIARLVSISPDLRLIVATMLRSIPSMMHVILLLTVLLYIYAVMGFYLFHQGDPERWGTLGLALLSLFEVLTLEGWPDMQASLIAQGGAYQFAWIYFASFIVIAVFVVINLFIAVVINNLQNVKDSETMRKDALRPDAALLAQIETLKTQLNQLEHHLRQREQ